MDNAEEVLQTLEEFSKLKPKEIPKELDEYLGYVAKTGDPVFQWQLVKYLFHEKLLSVITEFYETSPTIDLPPCPNVDPFNYERMKTSLLERLDTFSSAPFTIQRICELLTNPRKQYNRVDKFMRAIEKNILVVSTREPGTGKRLENDQTEAVLNGIPDSKVNENEDRIVNVCTDNLQYNSTTDSSQIPVENSVNACIIQEQIEIDNSATSTVVSDDTKSWCDEGNNEDDKNDSENIAKTDNLSENLEITVVSTSSSSVSNTSSELPKPNVLFAENEIEIKEKIDGIEETAEQNISNEQIVSSTPDSPDSPEPLNSDETCEPSSDENNPSPSKTAVTGNENEQSRNANSENGDMQNDNESISGIVEEEKQKSLENANEVTESSTSCDNIDASQVSEEIFSTNSQEVERQEDEATDDMKREELSPGNVQQPDSSNDSYQSEPVGDGNGDCDNSIEVNTVTQIEENDSVCNDSEVSEPNVSAELIDVSSSRESITIQEDSTVEEECTSEIIVKEVIGEDDETENLEKLEDIKPSVELSDDNVVVVNNDETVASSDDCVSVEEIKDDGNNTESGVVESSGEILDELCEQERKEGSIIHATSDAVEAEQCSNAVEEICVDQSSCGAEEEAMDVDETSNQPMVMSEGETEGEPMDQSENLQS